MQNLIAKCLKSDMLAFRIFDKKHYFIYLKKKKYFNRTFVK